MNDHIDRSFCLDCKQTEVSVHYVFGSRCDACSKAFKEELYKKKLAQFEKELERAARHICGEEIEDADDICQECCEHDDSDEHCCLICGADMMEDRMAAAYDYAKDRMKYGD
mgnify:CR=1 FL=1